MECANNTKKATEVSVNKSSVIVNQLSEDTEEEFASANIRNEPSNNTDHSPASIILLLYLVGGIHTIVFIVHGRLFGKHVLLTKFIRCYSHLTFVSDCYNII